MNINHTQALAFLWSTATSQKRVSYSISCPSRTAQNISKWTAKKIALQQVNSLIVILITEHYTTNDLKYYWQQTWCQNSESEPLLLRSMINVCDIGEEEFRKWAKLVKFFYGLNLISSVIDSWPNMSFNIHSSISSYRRNLHFNAHFHLMNFFGWSFKSFDIFVCHPAHWILDLIICLRRQTWFLIENYFLALSLAYQPKCEFFI
jgi:hypothetical protein